ncbi:MAG TPA: efflux RND transporter permease subunit [Thermoanaerobaculia bacterium]
MSRRPLARLIVTLALLVLGGVALARLPLDYLPQRSFPELTVGLALGEDLDPAEVSREWMEPIESAARSLGRVRGMAGEVRTDGAELTVRFAPGTDPERKAARLDSELTRLRARLPGGAVLWVDPAAEREGDFLAIVWLSGVRDDGGVHAAAEAIRAVPGVRDVRQVGAGEEEVRVELAGGALDPWGLAGTILDEARRSLRTPALGWSHLGDRRRPVVAQTRGELRMLPIPTGGGAVPLGSLAAIHERRKPQGAEIRFQGEPARALYVWRTHGAQLLAVDRALRERLGSLPGGIRGEVGWSEADPLRELARRLALAGLLSVALAAAVGAWRGGRWGALSLGLALPAVISAAANAFLLAELPLNVATLIALAVAATGLIPLAMMRMVRGSIWIWGWTAVAAAATVPVAVALASAELGPLLAEPAKAFWLAVAAGVGAVAILPTPPPRSPHPLTPSPAPSLPPTPGEGEQLVWGEKKTTNSNKPLPLSRCGWEGGGGRGGRGVRVRGGRRLLGVVKSPLRDPGTALLAAATAAYLAIALFGGALVPRPGELRPDQSNLSMVLRLPPGTPLDETVRRVRKAEELLGKAEEVERVWSYSTPGLAEVVAELRPDSRSPEERRPLVMKLQYEMSGLGAVEITNGRRRSGGRSAGFLADLEDRAETDEEATRYRVVLRGADLGAVRTAYDRILNRLEALKVRRHWISGWGDPAVHLLLRPRHGATAEEAAEIAGRLRRESAPPPALPLPARIPGGAERSLTVVPAGTPEDLDRAIPQITALLGQPLRLGDRTVVPASRLALTEEALYPRVIRQSGRFVVPIEIRLPSSSEEVRKQRRKEVDRSLGLLPLPAGGDLERPSLTGDSWRRERVRVVALALAVPLLLFAVAACRLGSLTRGLATLLPLAMGLLAALPFVAFSLGRVDELTVLALAAALALALPSAAEAAAPDASTGGRLYRSLRQQVPWLAGASPLLALVLAAPALGVEPTAAPWSVPLRAAAVAGGAALAGSLLLAPALLLVGDRWKRRDPEETRRRRHPPAWTEPGEPRLEVRSLTKVYGGSFKALSGVDFALTPGIVGLLGPNGAGKTTLLRILTGLLEPTRGSVSYRGVAIGPENLAEYRRRIGFLPQEFNAYPGFTAEQFLDHWARERGMDDPRRRREEIGRLLDTVGLAEHANRKVRDYSGGMRQRVGIARALLGAPPILIVDEPTTGLDVESRDRFRRILLEQAGDRIVVFSTHIASDIEAAALRILLLHRGRLRFDGPPEDLVARARGRVFRALVADADLLEFSHRYRVTSRVRVLEGIQTRAIARPDEPLAGELVEPNLEEAYLAEISRADLERPAGA